MILFKDGIGKLKNLKEDEKDKIINLLDELGLYDVKEIILIHIILKYIGDKLEMIDLNKIKPNEIGKYSENLYKFLIKNKNCDKVYYCLDKDEQFDINKMNLQKVMIGYMKDELFYGKSLFTIVTKKNKSIECFDLECINFIDITNEFWNKYIEIGNELIKMKTVEFPYYLGDQVIELHMYDDGTYDYNVITIKKISINENEDIELYYEGNFICYIYDINSFKKIKTVFDDVYIFSSLDKMNEFINSKE